MTRLAAVTAEEAHNHHGALLEITGSRSIPEAEEAFPIMVEAAEAAS
jgi:hypothetical protein